jgi:hypothetical protein
MHVQAQTFKDIETRLDPGAGARVFDVGAGAGVFDVAFGPHM